jgi:hypothetical protein
MCRVQRDRTASIDSVQSGNSTSLAEPIAPVQAVCRTGGTPSPAYNVTAAPQSRISQADEALRTRTRSLSRFVAVRGSLLRTVRRILHFVCPFRSSHDRRSRAKGSWLYPLCSRPAQQQARYQEDEDHCVRYNSVADRYHVHLFKHLEEQTACQNPLPLARDHAFAPYVNSPVSEKAAPESLHLRKVRSAWVS